MRISKYRYLLFALVSEEIPVLITEVIISGWNFYYSILEVSLLIITSIYDLLENDQLFPDDVRIAGQKHLEESGIEHEIKVYPDVPHGKSDYAAMFPLRCFPLSYNRPFMCEGITG